MPRRNLQHHLLWLPCSKKILHFCNFLNALVRAQRELDFYPPRKARVPGFLLKSMQGFLTCVSLEIGKEFVDHDLTV